ncbi:unnamed protein product [Closterium sp. NIES-54]
MTGTDSRGANGEMAGAREAGEQGGVAGGRVGTHQPANPTLPTSSTPSPTTVDPVKAFSIEKFMGEDYEHWSFRMRLMYTQYKLLDLVEGKEKMPEAAELKGAWMKRSFDAYMLMVQAACMQNKFVRFSFPRAEGSAKAPLEVVHMDLVGPTRTEGTGGVLYFLTMVDEWSRFTWARPLSKKSEVVQNR